jgi:hypothetical protein
MSVDPNHYFDLGCIPENVTIRDLSYLKKDTITGMYSHWKDCASHDMPIVCFVGYRQADFYDAHTKEGAAKGKSRRKPDYVEVSSDEEGLLKKVDDGKSSSDEDDLVKTPTIADSSPKYHLDRDMVPYLKSLSTVPSYQCLLTAVQKLLVKARNDGWVRARPDISSTVLLWTRDIARPKGIATEKRFLCRRGESWTGLWSG